jgi:hypothetical protein
VVVVVVVVVVAAEQASVTVVLGHGEVPVMASNSYSQEFKALAARPPSLRDDASAVSTSSTDVCPRSPFGSRA